MRIMQARIAMSNSFETFILLSIRVYLLFQKPCVRTMHFRAKFFAQFWKYAEFSFFFLEICKIWKKRGIIRISPAQGGAFPNKLSSFYTKLIIVNEPCFAYIYIAFEKWWFNG